MTTLTLADVQYGEAGGGVPVAILHGLFGSGRNWATIARQLAETLQRPVMTLDARNHGASPWAEAMDYRAMAEDAVATLRGLGHRRVQLLGHSMGGKAAMAAALLWPEFVERLVVVDIAPVAYRPHHLGHVQAMRALDLAAITRRGDADKALAAAVPDAAERGFLLQNLVFDPASGAANLHPDLRPRAGEGAARAGLPNNPPPQSPRQARGGEGRVGVTRTAHWRLNLEAIERGMPDLTGWPELPTGVVYERPALFIAGAASDYVRSQYDPAIRKFFPQAKIVGIPGAGHWVHAEQPQAFLNLVKPFLTVGCAA